MMKHFILASALAVGAQGWSQSEFPLTPFTQGFLTNGTAAEARAYLGVEAAPTLGLFTPSAPLMNISGNIVLPQAGANIDGYLGASDWTAFSAKLDSNSGTGRNNNFHSPTNWGGATMWVPGDDTPTLAMYGDYRNGVDGERYSTVFSGYGNPALTLNGWVTLNGNPYIANITADKSYMMAIGLDVPYGIITYGNGVAFSHYEQLPDGYPTSPLYPNGAEVFSVGPHGEVTLVNVDGAGFPFPQVLIQSKTHAGDLSNNFGIYGQDNLLQIAPVGVSTNMLKGISVWTNGNVGIGITNPTAFPPAYDLQVSGTAFAQDLRGGTISAYLPGINTEPTNQKLWVSGVDTAAGGSIRGRLGIGISDNQDYGAYFATINWNNGWQQVGQLGTRVGSDQPAITMQGGKVTIGATNLPTVALDVYGAGKFSGPVSVGEPAAAGDAATARFVTTSIAQAADEILSVVETDVVPRLVSAVLAVPTRAKSILYANEALLATGATNYTIDFHHTNGTWPVIQLANKDANFSFINIEPGRSTTVFLDAFNNAGTSLVTWPTGVITNVNNTGVVPAGYLKVINLYAYDGTNSSSVIITEGALNKR